MSAARGGRFPTGPWVLVVGMHRSGTSAVTGALGRLGLQLPAGGDLVTGRFDNPAHHESDALNRFDDELLRVLGGSWSGPPIRVDVGWEDSARVDALVPRAREAARRAFPPEGANAWKDPRLCLLLPFWRRQLDPGARAVLVWRDPLSAARSLHVRQNFTMSLSLALWLIYIRRALEGLRGMPVMVVSFDRLLDDPLAGVTSLAEWIDGSGLLASPVDDAHRRSAAASVSAGKLHGGDVGPPPEPFAGVVGLLRSLEGRHDEFPELVVEDVPPWALDALRQRREFEVLYLRYLRTARWRRRLAPWRGRSWSPPT